MPGEFRGNKIVVTDASCFILLHKINATYILNELFAIVMTTPEIAQEFGIDLPDWVVIQAATDTALYENFKQYVDPGEASAIALASEINCDYLILDDAQARKFAEKLGFPVKGTAGILLSAKQQGVIPAVRPYLHLIQQTNFRISQVIVNRIIAEAGEDF